MEHVKYILKQSWSRHSSSKWTEECPSCGQCGVTALVIQDHFGGTIFKTKVGESWHFYNSINGVMYDFTSEQFQAPIEYQHIPSSREEAFLDTNEEQSASSFCIFPPYEQHFQGNLKTRVINWKRGE